MIAGPLIHRVRKARVEAVSRIRANASPRLSFSFALIQSTMAVRRTATTIAAKTSKSMTRPAGAVILQSSLTGVDELMHIGRRMRGIALTRAVGGMGLSLIGMGAASVGLISPIQAAIAQEVIDLLSILNSLRMILPTGSLTDFRMPLLAVDATQNGLSTKRAA